MGTVKNGQLENFNKQYAQFMSEEFSKESAKMRLSNLEALGMELDNVQDKLESARNRYRLVYC